MKEKSTRRIMPIGVDDFAKIIRGGYCFIGKTRFIKEILDGRSEATLITRPRRFGKTLNLSMLRYFFTLENRERNRELFAGLDIERAGEEYMREQGSRPVVFLSLKDVQARDFAGLLEKLSELMGQIYDRAGYLQESEALSPQEKKYSNKESGYGRFDIAFFPLKDNLPGVVLELKVVKEEEEMESAAKAAFFQIENKEYTAGLVRQGVTEVWKYGIAFHGKKVWLERG